MNYRRVLKTIGGILLIEGIVMLLPIITALCYKEFDVLVSFIIPMAFCFCVGFLLKSIKLKDDGFYAREGFVTVGLSWIFMSLIGAVPFVLSGDIPNYIDAVFETVSGFTTTGMTAVLDVEALSKAALMWRSVVSFMGGMGVLVFMLAVMPENANSTMHIYRAETTGIKATKLVSKMRFTARILYLIYLVMTVICTIMLCFEMPFFDAVCHAMSTASTCGYSTKNASLGAYGLYSQMVIMVFMFLFSINFSLFYLILIGKVKDAFKNEELRIYFFTVLICIIIVAINIADMYGGFFKALQYSGFNLVSLVTTTGFNNVPFYVEGTAETNWPTFSIAICLFLMLMGGMAGSTAGGLKASRVGILGKSFVRDLRKNVKPNKIIPLKFEGKTLGEAEVSSVKQYFVMYFCVIIFSVLLLSIYDYNLQTSLTASISAIGNVGPAFGLVNYGGYVGMLTPVSKIVLILDMLIGRLEILPILVLFVPGTWRFK